VLDREGAVVAVVHLGKGLVLAAPGPLRVGGKVVVVPQGAGGALVREVGTVRGHRSQSEHAAGERASASGERGAPRADAGRLELPRLPRRHASAGHDQLGSSFLEDELLRPREDGSIRLDEVGKTVDLRGRPLTEVVLRVVADVVLLRG
jgi:hypothetical protein